MESGNYLVNTDSRLIAPNIHDLEVRRVEFDRSYVNIGLAQTQGDERLIIRVRNVDRIAFFSDIIQNVIYDAYLFTATSEKTSLFAKVVEIMRLKRQLAVHEKLLFLEPAAGLELAVMGDDIIFIDV